MKTRWSDYKHNGRWTHSLLHDEDGNYLGQCYPQYADDHSTRIVKVHWSDMHAFEGTADTQRQAKQAVRKQLKEP